MKERNAAFIKVYQDYIKDYKVKLKGQRKTDDTS